MRHGKARSAKPTDRHAAFATVGIGASAGGLDAFKKFFSAMPADCGAAFVLIQHLDPTRDSLTAELVGTYTRMRVVQAKDEMRVAANHVYVIPPNKYLSIRAGTLRLSAPTAPRGLRMAIDFFLRSLAEDQHERAIGIILSGTGTDGTLGLKEIRAAGGMTIVQDPATAQHDGMLRSAIATGGADYILPAEQMADALLKYVRQAYLKNGSVLPERASDPLASTVALLQAHTAFDFSGYKMGTLRRRIERRMSLKQVDRMAVYVEKLRSDPTELAALFKDLLINVTSFFRDPAAWQILQEPVIRQLVAQKDTAAPIRVWIPACATGEEAYSIAMLLVEEVRAAGKTCPLQVFASDVDGEALEVARAGVYPESIAADVPLERLHRFFILGEHGYRVTKELRDAVVFTQQNLLSDPPFSQLDFTSCRNLLIYLEPPLQHRIIGLLHSVLVDGGYLFLGSAEGVVAQEDLFEVVSKKWRIYRRIGATRRQQVRFPLARVTASSLVPGRTSSLPSAGRLAPLTQPSPLERSARASVPAGTHASGNPDGADTALVHQLEHELTATKEDLRLSIEDLRSANEELMSVNEELRASNEELETSKEELQSLNEELTTSNAQLEDKITELEASNNDLDNLLSSTNIATLFLDTRLRIRRFTPATIQLFSLIAPDVGRPISDIAQKFSDPALLSDAAAVLRQPMTAKTEVQAQDGKWYVRQVLPYRTRDDRIDGVVITFSDVAAEALQKARLYAESIVHTVREPLLVLDGDLRVRSANQSFYATFRVLRRKRSDSCCTSWATASGTSPSCAPC